MVEKIRYNIISIKINVLHKETHEGFSRRNKITREKIRYNMISIKMKYFVVNKKQSRKGLSRHNRIKGESLIQ